MYVSNYYPISLTRESLLKKKENKDKFEQTCETYEDYQYCWKTLNEIKIPVITPNQYTSLVKIDSNNLDYVVVLIVFILTGKLSLEFEIKVARQTQYMGINKFVSW